MNMYLPNVSDWNNWSSLNKEYSTLVADMPILNTLGILIALREWSLLERPPTRLEIRIFLYETGLEGPNPWQLVLPNEPITEKTREKSTKGLDALKSTEHLVFKELEKRELIKSETVNSYRKKKQPIKPLLENSRVQERIVTSSLHGREKLYQLTPKGSLFLEIMIQKPWLHFSLVKDAAKRGFTTVSILSWAYLKDKRRTEEYIFQFPEFKSLIPKMKFENYSKMLNPLTRILVEFKLLSERLEKYERIIEFDRLDFEEKQSFKKIFESKSDSYDPLRKIIIEEFRKMSRSYLDIIIKEAEDMGLSLETLKKHTPP
jgi:hypothetical protein